MTTAEDPVIREIRYLNSQITSLRSEIDRKRVGVLRIAVGVTIGIILHSLFCAAVAFIVLLVVPGLLIGAGAAAGGFSSQPPAPLPQAPAPRPNPFR